MAQDNNNSNKETEFKLVIENEVVEKIAALTVTKIDGIMELKGNFLSSIQETFGGEDKTKGANADVHDGETTSIGLYIILEYGKSANEVFNNIKRQVAKNVKEMTSLDIDEMTVHVVDVMTREEYKAKQAEAKNKRDSDDSDN